MNEAINIDKNDILRIHRIQSRRNIMSHSIPPAVTLSVRISPKMRDQLEDLATATGRTKSFLAAEAIEQYLEVQTWQVKAIQEAVQNANSKTAKFIEHERIVTWVNSWGSDNELEPPE
jgi:RHH-type transcriptional regulator, rel operon repressor / antitoxin RelB